MHDPTIIIEDKQRCDYTIMIKKKENYQNKVFKFPGFMI